jgi:hypothetical protein
MNEGSILASGSVRRLTLFSAVTTSSPGTGTVAANFSGTQTGCIVIVVQYTGQDTTDAVLQPTSTEGGGSNANSLAITLGSSLASASNQILAFIGHSTNEAQTAGGGGTQLASSDVGYTTPTARLAAYSEVNDNSVSASWATSSAKLAIACEVKAATVAGSVVKRWDGSAFQTTTVKRWDGSAWQTATVKRWDGSAWV